MATRLCHRRLAILLGSAALVGLGLTGHTFQSTRMQPPPKARAALPGPRFVVVANPATVAKGKASVIDVQLRTSTGAPTTARGDTPVIVTVTTLPTLDAAKKNAVSVPPPGAKPATLDRQRLNFPAGARTQRVSAIFPKGLGQVTFSLTPNTVGLIRVFVEAAGIEAGSTIIAASDSSPVPPKGKRGASLEASPETRPETDTVQLVSFRQKSPPVRLVIIDSGRDVLRRGGELSQSFFVGLETEDGGGIARAPRDLTVDLRVSGKAHFEPRALKISATQALSTDTTELRSSLGGTVDLAADAGDPGISAGRLQYRFQPGRRTTHLTLRELVPSALANGLDAIPIEVKGVYRPDDQESAGTAESVVTPQEEGLEKRRVIFSFANGSAKLREGGNELDMPKDAQSSTVYIVATSPSRALRIRATASNGLSDQVSGEATVPFNLPWLQLLAAAGGGVLLTIVRRKRRWWEFAVGVVCGAILYVLMFFGAITTSALQLGSFAVALTRLPTENVLAASVLGVLGSWALSEVLTSKQRAKR